MNRGSLQRHLYEECQKVPRYLCHLCGKRFTQKTNGTRHVSTVHSSRNYTRNRVEKPFPCSKCNRSYLNRSTLNRHLREECGKLPTWLCRYCQKAFKQPYRSTRDWTCKLCGKQYHWRDSLNRHIRLESGEGAWTCFQCGRHYRWKESLTRHLRVECNREPAFSCEVCGRKFKHKHHWTTHNRIVHSLDGQNK
ncbi:zinc finger protein 2-like [Leptopilina heterotoma]|uniref:zinc finger protein 2-like n=1 Tax=Leptopilina heterotoma TaxID=63436 RepID=UPI001CA88899|nr:zinc finger protein 2-like [Leptopilina heterotoma]